MKDERHAWAAYLARLEAKKRKCVLEMWQRVTELAPNVMYPTAGTTEDGDLHLAWNLPERTIVVEVHPAGISWFYEDRTAGQQEGSEEEESRLPTRFYSLLRTFVRS